MDAVRLPVVIVDAVRLLVVIIGDAILDANSVDAVNIPPVNVEKFVVLMKVPPSNIFVEI